MQFSRITHNPALMGGKPSIRGLRVTVTGPPRKDVDALAKLLKDRFGNVAIRHDYGWPQKPALCVLDCVLSLNRRYDKVVYPRVLAFSQRHPEVVELRHLRAMLRRHPEVGSFCRERVNYNDPRREQTLCGVV